MTCQHIRKSESRKAKRFSAFKTGFLFNVLLDNLKGYTLHAAVGALSPDKDGGGAAFCVVVAADDLIRLRGQVVFRFSSLFIEPDFWCQDRKSVV